ncbi:hypothetical protein EV356DRAFT_327409 [Viridothelium virens]|uniref:Uncharacterized protein n=1 Tax=Viridothelium virens TaxID=1048519 RepID=A0A6A6GZ27_VIRVR|nr:hypothetical protein EV356DRAFT_327409 [Viridothelium virens]
MRRIEQISVYVILGFGYLLATCSIGKIISMQWIVKDFSWSNGWIAIWGSLEHLGGVTVLCMPILRALLSPSGRKFFPKLRLSRSKSSPDARSEDEPGACEENPIFPELSGEAAVFTELSNEGVAVLELSNEAGAILELSSEANTVPELPGEGASKSVCSQLHELPS